MGIDTESIHQTIIDLYLLRKKDLFNFRNTIDYEGDDFIIVTSKLSRQTIKGKKRSIVLYVKDGYLPCLLKWRDFIETHKNPYLYKDDISALTCECFIEIGFTKEDAMTFTKGVLDGRYVKFDESKHFATIITPDAMLSLSRERLRSISPTKIYYKVHPGGRAIVDTFEFPGIETLIFNNPDCPQRDFYEIYTQES